MLADDELIVINHDESREGGYIRIRILLLGEELSNIHLDVSVFHDVDILTISELTALYFSQNSLEPETLVPNKTRLKPSLPVLKENLLSGMTLDSFVNDADIVLLVADGNDRFAVENICKIIEILDKNGVLYVKILAIHNLFLCVAIKMGISWSLIY